MTSHQLCLFCPGWSEGRWPWPAWVWSVAVECRGTFDCDNFGEEISAPSNLQLVAHGYIAVVYLLEMRCRLRGFRCFC
jgi:hypothetical protein